mgnify:CR=1 FL=1
MAHAMSTKTAPVSNQLNNRIQTPKGALERSGLTGIPLALCKAVAGEVSRRSWKKSPDVAERQISALMERLRKTRGVLHLPDWVVWAKLSPIWVRLTGGEHIVMNETPGVPKVHRVEVGGVTEWKFEVPKHERSRASRHRAHRAEASHQKPDTRKLRSVHFNTPSDFKRGVRYNLQSRARS